MFRGFKCKNAYEGHFDIVCNNKHDVNHKGKQIKETRIYKDMANMMYPDTPLHGSKEEIALLDASTEDGAEKIECIKHPTYIIFDSETDCSM